MVQKTNQVRPLVCVQGLGFVGAAMCAAVAGCKNEDGKPCFDVIGLDLDNAQGLERIESINKGLFPFTSGDDALDNTIKSCHIEGNLSATSDECCLQAADIVIVDVHLDVITNNNGAKANLKNFISAIQTIGKNIKENTLVIVETTVPPGTCQLLVLPCLQNEFKKRNLDVTSILLAHSYERVMPGPNYLNSIVNFWRVFAGTCEKSSFACEKFLNKVVNTKDFPLTKLSSTTASETAKVIENTYRAVNIALTDEWGAFAESAGIDIFEIIDAIKVRPTHSNLMRPGFGVGGYCLTKDPLFAEISCRSLLNIDNIAFPFSNLAIETNGQMPVRNLDRIEQLIGKTLKGKNIILLGITYRPEVADTRYSASQRFYEEALKRKARVTPHDPHLTYWDELDIELERDLPTPTSDDIVVFGVAHKFYQDLNIPEWLGTNRPFIYDANDVLGRTELMRLKDLGFTVGSTGRG